MDNGSFINVLLIDMPAFDTSSKGIVEYFSVSVKEMIRIL